MTSPRAQSRSSRIVLATRRVVTSAGKETGPFASSTNQRKSWKGFTGSTAGGGGGGAVPGNVAPVAVPLVEARRPEGGRPALRAAARARARAPAQLLARPARGRWAGGRRPQQQRRPGGRHRGCALHPSLLEPRISSAATWRIANVAWQMEVARAPAHCSRAHCSPAERVDFLVER